MPMINLAHWSWHVTMGTQHLAPPNARGTAVALGDSERWTLDQRTVNEKGASQERLPRQADGPTVSGALGLLVRFDRTEPERSLDRQVPKAPLVGIARDSLERDTAADLLGISPELKIAGQQMGVKALGVMEGAAIALPLAPWRAVGHL